MFSIKSIFSILSVEDVPKKLSTFLEDYEEYSSKIATYKQKELTVLTKNITSLTELKNKKNIYVGQVSLDSNNEVKDLALQCISTQKIDIIVLVSEIGNKTAIVGATAKILILIYQRLLEKRQNSMVVVRLKIPIYL